MARTIDPATAAGPAPPTRARAMLRLARPRQWSKNVLVFAAPGAAGVLDNGSYLADTLLGFVCFCLAASGTYFLNDARDVEADRRHPTKQFRPLAAGIVPVQTAYVAGFLLLAASVGFAAAVSAPLVATIAGYVAMTTAYSFWLKHIAVVDLAAVAAGFVLRAIGGAAAADVPISDWFFIVTCFGSLFMVSGKRGAEAAEMGEGATGTRSVLANYTSSYSAYLRSVSSGAVLVAYCLWAFEKENATDASVPWYQLSIVPFVLAILRYALVLDQGRGSAPEEVVFSDRTLQVIGVVWVVVFGLGVYAS